MECKVVREHLENDRITEEVITHLMNCNSCKAYKDELMNIEMSLRNTYSGTMLIKSVKSDVMNQIRPTKSRKLIIALVAVFLMITMSFAEEISTLAHDIPIIGELLDYFIKDEGAEYAKENDVPVNDYILTKDGYTLLINDFYADPYTGVFDMALKKDDEYIKGFSYAIIREDKDVHWVSDRVTNTPWRDGYVVKEPDEDMQFRIGIRHGEHEVIFDEISIVKGDIDQYQPKMLECDFVIEDDFGRIKITGMEIYPTAMYMIVEHDLSEDVISYHFKDISIKDNLNNVYDQFNVVWPVSGKGKSQVRFLGSCYFNEEVSELQITYSKLRISLAEELVSMSPDELEGYEFYRNERYSFDTYVFDNVKIDDGSLSFELLVKIPSKMSYPPYLFVYNEGSWQYIMDVERVVENLPEDQQNAYLPMFVFNKWFGEKVKYIYYQNGEYYVEPMTDESDPFYAYRKSTMYSRGILLSYLKASGYEMSEKEFDYLLGNESSETMWLTIKDLEIVSGMTVEELLESDEGKVKLIDYLAENYYMYYDLDRIAHTIESIQKYGSIGIGNDRKTLLTGIKYSMPYDDGQTHIRLGIFNEDQNIPGKTFSLELD